MAEVAFTDGAIDDLRRLGPDVVPKVLKKLLILLDDPKAGHPLGAGLTGFRKLVVGRNHWRVVYRITDEGSIEICEIWCVGARSDAAVYAEAAARAARLGDERPELRRLTEVIDKLGRLTGGVAVEEKPRSEPVPDWLAHRLVHTVGMAPEKVAALDLEEAVDRWTTFMSTPR